MASEGNVRIEGLRELQHALSQFKRDIPSATDAAEVAIAQDWVNRAQRAATRPQQAKAAMSMTVSPGADGASISSSLEWFFGAEFGGGSRPGTRQFPTFRGNRGYFLYPSQDDQAALTQLGEAIDKASKPMDHRGLL